MLGLSGLAMLYGSLYYYKKTLFYRRVKRDLSYEPMGVMDHLIGEDQKPRDKYQFGPKSVS